MRVRQGRDDGSAAELWQRGRRAIRENAHDRFGKRDGPSQSAIAVCRAGRCRRRHVSMSGCISVTSRTTTLKDWRCGWHGSTIRRPTTRPRRSSSTRCNGPQRPGRTGADHVTFAGRKRGEMMEQTQERQSSNRWIRMRMNETMPSSARALRWSLVRIARGRSGSHRACCWCTVTPRAGTAGP